MKPLSLVVVLFAAALLSVSVSPSMAQCNPSCQGDFNLDGQVTIDEIITAVNNALGTCEPSPEELGCLGSGGSVSTASCCSSAPEFPNTCSIGACSCAPQFSRELSICECGAGKCFDRDQRACVTRELSAEEQGCVDSGGTVSTASCCSSAPEFPNTCSIGACSCAPQSSRELSICDCGAGKCFDRDQRACVTR